MSEIILGAGMTGLAAGLVSKFPVFEAIDSPGGICSSYYIRPGDHERLPKAPADGQAYRFEIGGGHWIFGGDPSVLRFIRTLVPVKEYVRRSSVYFYQQNLYVPYPLQNHLRFFKHDIISQALEEITRPKERFITMKEWLEQSFGSTLCQLFFYPFHALYTANLYEQIAPQDTNKSPVNLPLAIKGAFNKTPLIGYNVKFVYPVGGLDTLVRGMADRCNMQYGKTVTAIDVHRKEVHFSDGAKTAYDTLISTLPLDRMMQMTGLEVEAKPDPYTSVCVLNIGAIRGKNCPDDHWLYIPYTRAGFHRVGFYSNIDRSFLPAFAHESDNRVSLYIERAYASDEKPLDVEVAEYAHSVVQELQEWDFIGDTEVVDSTWLDVAYTWSWPDSMWKYQALNRLEMYDIVQVGRYGRWVFQGIADSIRDGLLVGASLI
jgi:protoporphyrinogen oxidase